ncbi:hypothetical protein VQL36_03375 [Chengkuizengella sp. SCS-71B]|uniref:hypothetical protein n=1 Tax=Chengkuizengella sp. SCS-71B TaxID=3115290 RepID=UPI0032C217EF
MKKKNFKNVFIGIVVILFLLFIFKNFNDYREGNLADLIIYEQEILFGLGFAEGSNKSPRSNWKSTWLEDDKETVEKLIDFLSQYQVKKINSKQYDEEFNQKDKSVEEEIFEFEILHKGNTGTSMYLLGDRIHIRNKGYYDVLNGPIDSDWLSDFFKKIYERNKE